MFINRTNKYKFYGKFILLNVVYIYILYLPIIYNKIRNYLKYENEIITYFGNRYVNGSKCLQIDENYIKTWMPTTDAYVIVYRENNPDDIASCTINIHNMCILNNMERDLQVYIYDLCRVKKTKKTKETYKSPVYGLFYFIENLAYQNLSKKDIYLMVDTSNSSKNKLIEIYKKYGFILKETDCIPIVNRIVMYKKITQSVIFNSSLDLFYLGN